ncbi:MAG: enoyl-ACP reductase FabI [Nitriliruptorales bacterium]|nr:enoyl-ACP reductase FabI [Nitriliruptorales bacterium]
MLLENKRLLVTGVLTEASIAFSVARLAQEAGAEVVLSGFGRGLRITQGIAKRLPTEADVIELDVTKPDDLAAAAADIDSRWGALDGVVHAIGFAPAGALGGRFMQTSWEDVATTLQVSTYSFAALAAAMAPLLKQAGGGSIVGLDFDASVAWPGYDWMGVAKAGLESCCRYVARDLGPQNIRVNLVAAGPLRTMAAKAIDGFSRFEDEWAPRAPLGWNVHDAEPVGRVVCALLSDWTPAVTGEIVHVDGGAHAVGTGAATEG